MSEPIVLAPRLDLSAAQGLLTVFTQNQEDDVILDMNDVNYLGAMCLQVMISAASAARAEERGFSMINVSDRVLDQLRAMGLTPEDVAKGHQ